MQKRTETQWHLPVDSSLDGYLASDGKDILKREASSSPWTMGHSPTEEHFRRPDNDESINNNNDFGGWRKWSDGATIGRAAARPDRGESVKVIVRSPDSLPEPIKNHDNLTVIHASLLDLSDAEMARYVSGCDAVASCLGHNITMKAMYGQPRKLVTDATRRLCDALKANNSGKPVKFVLMNTTGNSNRDLDEPVSFRQRSVTGLLRVLLPPHVDNEKAADYLRTEIGQNEGAIEWAVVRPDNLIDENEVTPYDVYASPTRDPIFDAGETSRINVGSFMADLIVDDELWNQWKGQMPVIYNQEASSNT